MAVEYSVIRGRLPEKGPSQTEWSSHPSADGGNLIIFSRDSTPLSWLRLKPKEDLALLRLDGKIVNSPWVKTRVGSIPVCEQNIPVVVQSNREDINVIDTESLSLDPTSKKYQGSAIETTDLDVASGELATVSAQKSEAKTILNTIIEERLRDADRAINIYDTPGGDRVYHVIVDEEIQAASSIAGDTASRDNRYNPEDKKNKNILTANGLIPLYIVGDDLLVQVNAAGSYLYLSKNFGKIRTAATGVMEMAVGAQGEKVGALVERTYGKPDNSTKSKVARHFVHNLLNNGRSVLRPERPLATPYPTIESVLLNAVKKLMIDGEPNPVTETILQQYEIIVARLLKEVYPKHFNENTVNKWILKQLNSNVPEWWLEKNLEALGEQPTNEEILQVIAGWEAVGLVKKMTDDAARSIAQWYFAAQTLTNLGRYRDNVRAALGGKLPDLQVLKGVASGMTLNLGEVSLMMRDLKHNGFLTREAIEADPDHYEESDLGNLTSVKLDIQIGNTSSHLPNPTNEGRAAEIYTYPESVVKFPKRLLDAFSRFLVRYNRAFQLLAETNKEHESDYQYCFANGNFINRFVQVDFRTPTQSFLSRVDLLSDEELDEWVESNVFEAENNLARLPLLVGMFRRDQPESYFGKRYGLALDNIRNKFGMPIALVAVTEEKYVNILREEFGIQDATPETRLSHDFVRAISGYDMVIGPKEAEELIRSGEMNNILVYGRTSPPLSALRNTELLKDLHVPLLDNPENRRILRAQSLTPNFDPYTADPNAILNDTKAYQEALGIAFPVRTLDDLSLTHTMEYLHRRRIEPEHYSMHELRLKPNLRYGGYDHIREVPIGFPLPAELAREIEEALKYGTHYAQVEVYPTRVRNRRNGELYRTIERGFFAIDGDKPEDVHFLGSFGDMLLEDSVEAQKNTIHGQNDARWREGVAA